MYIVGHRGVMTVKYYPVNQKSLNSITTSTIITKYIHNYYLVRPKTLISKWSPANQLCYQDFRIA
jgi:hypothetical protein